MDQITEDLLRPRELEEYRRLLRTEWTEFPDDIRKPMTRQVAAVGVAYVVIAVILFAVMVSARDSSNAMTAIGFMLVWTFGAAAVWIAVSVHVYRSGRRTLVARYLTEIGYSERLAAGGIPLDRVKTSDHGPVYDITGNYDPARYYSYDKSERDYMRQNGMDADSYEANFRD